MNWKSKKKMLKKSQKMWNNDWEKEMKRLTSPYLLISMSILLISLFALIIEFIKDPSNISYFTSFYTLFLIFNSFIIIMKILNVIKL